MLFNNIKEKVYIDINSTGDMGFRFCLECQREYNCCTKVGVGKSIDLPFLIDSDIKRICKYLDTNKNHFINMRKVSNYYPATPFIAATENNAGCTFFQNNKCLIYPVRPIDCRLFPLDIMKKHNRYFWIIYTKLCPISINEGEILINGKLLLPSILPFIDIYATMLLKGMDKQEYKILEEIMF